MLKKNRNLKVISIAWENTLPTTCSSVQEWIARFGRSCQRRIEEQKHSHVRTGYCHCVHLSNLPKYSASVLIIWSLGINNKNDWIATLNWPMFDSVVIQYMTLTCNANKSVIYSNEFTCVKKKNEKPMQFYSKKKLKDILHLDIF